MTQTHLNMDIQIKKNVNQSALLRKYETNADQNKLIIKLNMEKREI